MKNLPTAMPMDVEVEMKPAGLTFAPPTGFTPPDTYEEGKPFEAVAELVMEDGMLRLKSVNGASLETEAEDDKDMEDNEMEMDDDEDEAESMMVADGGQTLADELRAYGAT